MSFFLQKVNKVPPGGRPPCAVSRLSQTRYAAPRRVSPLGRKRRGDMRRFQPFCDPCAVWILEAAGPIEVKNSLCVSEPNMAFASRRHCSAASAKSAFAAGAWQSQRRSPMPIDPIEVHTWPPRLSSAAERGPAYLLHTAPPLVAPATRGIDGFESSSHRNAVQ
jgi:hypothetical protein